MASGPEGFEVSFDEAMNDWFIVHSHMKGSVLHREILADRFESEEDANNAADEMRAKLSL